MKNIFISSCPFIFIGLIWFLFSYPYFLQGKVPYSATYQNNNFAPWEAYPNLSGPVKNNAMPDVTTQIIPWKHFTIETYKKGQIPFWNPNSFSGTPHLANYQSAVLSPLNVLFFIFPFFDAWSLLILLQPLLAGVFMYLFARSLQTSKTGSLLSASAFMFCGFIVVWMDYGTLAYAILFLPLALFAIEKFYYTNSSIYLCLLSLTIPLSFFSGHFQISIYFLLTIFVWILYKNKERGVKGTVYLFVYSFLGILITLPQILPSMEFYTQSLRSNLFQKGEVIPWAYVPTFFAPDFFGNPVTRNDWFGHYAEWNEYIGIFPLMLGFYALKKRTFQVYFLFIFASIVILLAFPTPVLDLVINLHIPVLSTSAASRIIVLFSFLFTVLAGIGFDTLLDDLRKRNNKPVIFWLLSFCLVFLLIWVVIFLKLFIPKSEILTAKQNLILPSTLFAAITVIVCLVIFIERRVSTSKLIFIGGISFVLLTSFDMLRFVTKWQAFDPKRLAFNDVGVTKFFPQISGFDRVIGNFGAEAATYYNLPSLEGYDALYIKRYGEFIASLSTGKIQEAYRSVVAFPKDSIYTPKAIKLLHVGYIVHKVSDDNRGWTFPYWKYPIDQFQKVYDDGLYRIYKNTAVFPRAFLVSNYVVKTDPQDIFSTLFSDNFNLRNTIILEKNPGIDLKNFITQDSVHIAKYTPDIIDISSDVSSNRLLLLSDPYYPGWKAFIDGKQTEIMRTDYAFRAVKISPGKHIIEFIYKPTSFFIGVYAALFSILCILGLTFFTSRKLVKLRL